MAITKTAVLCPLPMINSTFMTLDDYSTTSGVPDTINAQTVLTGDVVWGAKFNRNGAYLDVLGSYGGGIVNQVVHGLTCSAGSGMTLNVAAGGAIIGGVVQLPSATTAVCSVSSDNWVYLKQDGTIEVVVGSLTPPADPCVLLCLAVTDGSGITSVNVDGVVYANGIPYRETADLGYPTDTPPACVLLTKTAGGYFLWCGTEYKRLNDVNIVVQAVTANYSELASDYFKVFTNEGATSKPIITLPSAVAGIMREYVVQDSDGLRIKANTGDTIRDGSSVSASAGYIESTTVGSVVRLLSINATEWIVMSKQGTWSVV